MDNRRYVADHAGKRFVIEETELVEFGGDNKLKAYYLYVYDGDNCVFDYLEDTVEMAKELANEDFLVPLDAWLIIEE